MALIPEHHSPVPSAHLISRRRPTLAAPPPNLGIRPSRTTASPPPPFRGPSASAVRRGPTGAPALGSAAPVAIPVLAAIIAGWPPARAWEWVAAARAASAGPPRYHLPGGFHPRAPVYTRRLASALAVAILRDAIDGNASSQIAALHFPLLFARRGEEISAQIAALQHDSPPSPRPPAPPREAAALWCRQISTAAASGQVRRVVDFLVAGPGDRAFPIATAPTWLDTLFPHPGDALDEIGRWSRAAAAHDACNAVDAVSARDVWLWARSHRRTTCDAGGWSASLVLHLGATEPEIPALLARFWSLAPHAIVDNAARSFAFRSAMGTLLQQEGKPKPRPIAAPAIPRRVASGTDARRARAVVQAYCEARGQLGASCGGALRAYSMFPRLAVLLGATTVSADSDSSYQRFEREALLFSASTLLASPAASSHPASAAAFARLATRYVFDTPHMPRTSTTFHRYASTRINHGLAQGCSASPSMEAIALATAPDHPASIARRFPGAISKGSHDDRQTTAMPGAPLAALARPAPWGGSLWNLTKCIAIGPRAAEAVAAGYAARAAPHCSVYGAPVGAVSQWVAEVWKPRWDKVVGGLRLAFSYHQEAAVAAAHLLGGPGSSASYWQGSAPATDNATAAILARADDDWVRMWLGFAGHPGRTPSAQDRARVFGLGPACLGHRSAGDGAKANYLAGAAAAWPFVARWAAEARCAWRDFARALDVVPADLVQSPAATPHSIGAHLQALSAAASGDWQTAREASHDLLMASRRPGARCAPAAIGRPNVLLRALSPSPCGDPLSSHLCGPAFVVARIFGLPVWPAMGISRPVACPRCNAAWAPLAAGPRVPTGGRGGSGSTVSPVGVATCLDEDGDHARCCRRQRRGDGCIPLHNGVVRGLAAIARDAGRDAQYHGGPVFTWGRKSAPADWMERDPRFPVGLCCDFTLGAASIASAEAREAAKVAKYAPQLRAHPHLGFAPFAVTNDGEIGGGAEDLCRTWARSLSARQAAAGIPVGAPVEEIFIAVSRTIVREIIDLTVRFFSGR